MKSRLFLFLLMILFASVSFMQPKKDVREILMSHTWYWYEEGYKDGQPQVRFIFTKDTVMSYFVGNKAYKNFDAKCPYYLSDVKDGRFDNEKIGKARNGKYLYQLIANQIFIMEIININETEIKFKAPTMNDGEAIRVYKVVVE